MDSDWQCSLPRDQGNADRYFSYVIGLCQRLALPGLFVQQADSVFIKASWRLWNDIVVVDEPIALVDCLRSFVRVATVCLAHRSLFPAN